MSSKFWLGPTSVSLLVFGGVVLAPAPGFAQERNPDRDAYFGETHVHTSWSLDAFAIGNLHATPGDAYKYFKGEPQASPRLRREDRHAA